VYETIGAALAGLAAGGGVAFFLARRGHDPEELERIQEEAQAKAQAAREEADAKAAAEIASMTERVENEVADTRSEQKSREDRLRQEENELEQRTEQLRHQEKSLTRREKDLGRREKKLDSRDELLTSLADEHKERLESIASLSQEEARDVLMDEVRESAMKASVDKIRTIEQEAQSLAQERARMIISSAIQRYASEHVGDRTVSAVRLPSEDMKGRIIGREGRNIRAFEAASGCDVVIDESPDTVMVSSFNPVRREVARLALGKLLEDGRIHPARIEEVVARTRKEVDQIVRKRGEAAALEVEIAGVHPEIIKMLGRLHFVNSFAQNVLRHSVEVAMLAGMMADELGLKRKQAVRAGLLHDIGKAVEHEAEGNTSEVGAALCRKHGESKVVVHTIGTLHDESKQNTPLAQIVAAAKILSEARPGARRESLAAYIKRLEDLEAFVNDFDGVERCFAIQSGSEVRVMVDNARMSDRDADLLAREIARRIGAELSIQGDVKVTVIRSVRAIQYAR
jgi:ribonucrease Y